MITNELENSIISQLTEREKEEVLKILTELSEGTSISYDKLKYADYKEIPVDILTFIKDKKYLGNAWHTSEGKFKLFPAWEKYLTDIFPDNLTTNYNNIIFSGARGLGKSELAVTIGVYLLYRVMCLKDPRAALNLKPTEKIAFAFMNITEILAEEIGIAKFQATVQMSPWFMERGTMSGRVEPVWVPPDYINIIIGSQPRHVIGQPIFFAFFDEISFIANQDIDKQKAKAIDMIDTALGGMKTRFTNRGKNPTVLVLASSKRSDKSFLEEHMKKKIETEGDNTFIVDEPVWKIRPSSEYSGERFFVGQGNKFLASEVIPLGADIKTYKDRGFKILEVPIEYKAKFLEDIDRALCDYAGVSSSELTKYISASRLSDIRNKNLKNLFVKDIIEVGNGPDDTVQYYDFIDMNLITDELKSLPLYIHLDMSISGDKTGISGVWIKGKKPSLNNDRQELYYQLAFNVSIKAPKGHQVSFAKNREFIYWLKENEFNVKGISTDTYQNATLAQDLLANGFDYEIISVDRVSKDKICEPYAYLKNTIYEKRISIYDSELLTEELLGLERNGNSGKIDHPDGGRYGSKDAADAMCGALWHASKHSEEYSFEFGESLDAAVDVSSELSEKDNKQQIIVDFEEELKRVSDDFSRGLINNKKEDDFYMDFGVGKATLDYDMLIYDGIIL